MNTNQDALFNLVRWCSWLSRSLHIDRVRERSPVRARVESVFLAGGRRKTSSLFLYFLLVPHSVVHLACGLSRKAGCHGNEHNEWHDREERKQKQKQKSLLPLLSPQKKRAQAGQKGSDHGQVRTVDLSIELLGEVTRLILFPLPLGRGKRKEKRTSQTLVTVERSNQLSYAVD
jgi:hypothetical protein